MGFLCLIAIVKDQKWQLSHEVYGYGNEGKSVAQFLMNKKNRERLEKGLPYLQRAREDEVMQARLLLDDDWETLPRGNRWKQAIEAGIPYDLAAVDVQDNDGRPISTSLSRRIGAGILHKIVRAADTKQTVLHWQVKHSKDYKYLYLINLDDKKLQVYVSHVFRLGSAHISTFPFYSIGNYTIEQVVARMQKREARLGEDREAMDDLDRLLRHITAKTEEGEEGCSQHRRIPRRAIRY